MEFLNNYVQNTKVVCPSLKLVGDIDFMTARVLTLLPTDAELKSLFIIKTLIFTTDTYSNTVEAETELVVNVHNHENDPTEIKELSEIQLYALFCYATIFNYMTITNKIIDEKIMRGQDYYKPTVIIPDFEEVRPDIIKAIAKAYGK